MVLVNETKNKFFKMTPPVSGDSFFVTSFGKIGGAEITRTVPAGQWDEVIKEKLDNGYVDQTELFEGEKIRNKNMEEKCSDKSLSDVLTRLRNCSRQMVTSNYTCTEPTKAMLDRAEELLDRLADTKEVWEFNEILLELFTVIPRRMRNVIVNTAKDEEDFAGILERESSLLDNLSVFGKSDSIYPEGITFDKCSEKDLEAVHKLFHSKKHKIKNVWEVNDPVQNEKFTGYLKKNGVNETKLLFHGSRTQNWWNILQKSLCIRPANAVITGSMFGNGLYFAKDAEKSLGYSSIYGSKWAGGTDTVGYLGIYEVAYNSPWHMDRWSEYCEKLDESKIREKGYGCVHAHAGKDLKFDEIVSYNRDACRIRYFLEVN